MILSADTLQRIESDSWKVKTSRSIDDVTRWGANSHWCTKHNNYAKQYIDNGELFAITKRGSRRPSYQLYVSNTKRIELRCRKDIPKNPYHFFYTHQELRDLIESVCPRLGESLDKSKTPDGRHATRIEGVVVSIGVNWRDNDHEMLMGSVMSARRSQDINVNMKVDELPELNPGELYEIDAQGHVVTGQLAHHSITAGLTGTYLNLTLQQVDVTDR